MLGVDPNCKTLFYHHKLCFEYNHLIGVYLCRLKTVTFTFSSQLISTTLQRHQAIEHVESQFMQ